MSIQHQVVIDKDDFETLERALNAALYRLDALESATAPSYHINMVRNELLAAYKLIGGKDA